MMALRPALLALAQASAADSQGPRTGDSFLQLVEAWSTIFLAAVVLALLVALVLLLLQLRRLARSLGTVAERVQRDAAPVLDRARSVAENVEFISAAVRTDVQKVNESVTRLNERLRQASDGMEARIQDFNALLEVLQEEAEELALDTVAAVRGVQAGTRRLTGSRRDGSGGVLAPGARRDGLERVAAPAEKDGIEEG